MSGISRKEPSDEVPQPSYQSLFLLTWCWGLRLIIVCSITWKVTLSSDPRKFASFHPQIISSFPPPSHSPIIMEEAREDAGEDAEWTDGEQVHIYHMAHTV